MVLGQSNSPGGTGVSGFNSSASGNGVSGQGFTGVNGAGAGSGVTGTSTSSTGSGVVGIMNSGGGYAGFLPGECLYHWKRRGQREHHHYRQHHCRRKSCNRRRRTHEPQPANDLLGYCCELRHQPSSGWLFHSGPTDRDYPIHCSRWLCANSRSLHIKRIYVPYDKRKRHCRQGFGSGNPEGQSFVDSGALNIPVNVGTPIEIFGPEASGGTFCQSGSNMTATVEYAMELAGRL